MTSEVSVKIIARIQSPFPGKFGIPRQSGRVKQIRSRIVFEPEFRNPDALRGLDGFSHLWLLWQFSEEPAGLWSPTVRPPRLGGNRRMGVFATRSPRRPNPIGMSCVKIERIVLTSDCGPYIDVSGADLMDGTPIFDLKPYLPGADCIPDATGGFADPVADHRLDVADPDGYLAQLSEETANLIRGVLSEDPRPSYQHDPDRIYAFECSGFSVRFRVEDSRVILCKIAPLSEKGGR